MDDIYQKKYNVIELSKLLVDYLKQRVFLWLIVVWVYLGIAAWGVYYLSDWVYGQVTATLAVNAATIAEIQTVNLSGSQVFVLVQFVVGIIGSVILPILGGLALLGIVHNLAAVLIFVTQDLQARQAECRFGRIFWYGLRRMGSLIVTDIALWFYDFMILGVLIIALLLSNSFLPGSWLIYLLGGIAVIIGILALNWSFVYQAVYRYKQNGNEAISYSVALVKKNFWTCLLYKAVSGGIFVLLVYLTVQKILTVQPPAYPAYLTAGVIILLLYNFITKLPENLLFINRDLVAREHTPVEELYGDLIVLRLAPLPSEQPEKPRKVSRRAQPKARGQAADQPSKFPKYRHKVN